MDRTYDIFEQLPSGAPVWRCAVSGHEAASARLKEIATETNNEVRVMHVSSASLVAVMNASRSSVDRR